MKKGKGGLSRVTGSRYSELEINRSSLQIRFESWGRERKQGMQR